MLLVGRSGNTPVAFVVLHEHTYRYCLASSVLKRYIEEFGRSLKIWVHSRRQFGKFRFHRNIYRKINLWIVHNYIVILCLTVILHKQNNHLALAIVANLRISRVGGIVHKRARRYLCHIFHVLVTFQLCNDIVWYYALRSHQAKLLVCNVTVMQNGIRGVLLIPKLVYTEIVYELSGNNKRCIVECRFSPRETWVRSRKICCVITTHIMNSRNIGIAVVYVRYIVERWRIGRVAYVEETDALSQVISRVIEICEIGLCGYLQAIMSLGQQSKGTIICPILESIIYCTATIHLGSCIILTEHIVEIGLRQHA